MTTKPKPAAEEASDADAIVGALDIPEGSIPTKLRYRLSEIELWERIGFWISISGGCYPILPVLIPSTYELMMGWMSWVEVVSYLACGMVLCFVLSGVVAFAFIPLTRLSLRLLNWQPSWVQRGIFCGSLVGSLCSLPISLNFAYYAVYQQDMQVADYLLFLGLIGLAILLGQIGGARGGIEVNRYQPQATQEETIDRLQFSLWQMMAATGIISVSMVMLKIMGLLKVEMLISAVACFVLHWLLKGLSIRIARWLTIRAERRRAYRRNKIRSHASDVKMSDGPTDVPRETTNPVNQD